MHIIGGTASQTTAAELAQTLKKPLVNTTSKRFPDQELYIRIMDDIHNEDIVIVQTTYPDPNIIELLLLQDAVNDAGADTITVIIPYYGYGRQDKQFKHGEPISAKTLAEHISLQADKIITVDPHKEHILDFFTVPALSTTALPAIAHYLQKQGNIDIILAPDKGAKHRAEQVSQIVGCDYDYLEKKRLDGNTVEITPKTLDAHNKNTAIIDDIISTGGTMAQAIRQLKTQGAKKITIACTHGVFAHGAKEKLRAAGCDHIICTDSIPGEFSKVKLAKTLAETLSQNIPT